MMDLRKIGKWVWICGLMTVGSAVTGQVAWEPIPGSVADRILPVERAPSRLISIRDSAPVYKQADRELPTHAAHILLLPSTAPHAFFCRMELLIEKSSSVPVIFRLGDVDQVNRLEGKTKPWVK